MVLFTLSSRTTEPEKVPIHMSQHPWSHRVFATLHLAEYSASRAQIPWGTEDDVPVYRHGSFQTSGRIKLVKI
jgi:hypothetical protein